MRAGRGRKRLKLGIRYDEEDINDILFMRLGPLFVSGLFKLGSFLLQFF